MDIFFGSEPKYSKFSNFSKSPITLDGKKWPTVEHYFQAMKTTDEEKQESIRKATGPKEAKYMGQSLALRDDWEDIKYNVMLKALKAKFSSEPFKSLLLDTGNAAIYEDNPYDAIWGTGVKGKIGTGKNLLGKALMQVRSDMLYSSPTLF